MEGEIWAASVPKELRLERYKKNKQKNNDIILQLKWKFPLNPWYFLCLIVSINSTKQRRSLEANNPSAFLEMSHVKQNQQLHCGVPHFTVAVS